MSAPSGGYLAPQTQSNYGTSAPPYALYPENVSNAPSGGINPPQQGTVRPYPNFNASQDAEALRKAMKGFGSDKTAIIRIMCNRSCAQRLEIVNIYKQMHGRDLIKDLKYELTGRLEDVIVGLCYSVPEYLARELNWAIAGLGTNEECLIEVLCTRSNAEIHAIKRCYQQIFNKDLERDIIGDTSSNFRRILVSLCNGSREEGMVPDACRARNDAHLLRQAGVDRWGTDVSTFNRIMATQSYEQLRLVFREYNALTNHTIAEAITREMSGDLKQAFLAVVSVSVLEEMSYPPPGGYPPVPPPGGGYPHQPQGAGYPGGAQPPGGGGYPDAAPPPGGGGYPGGPQPPGGGRYPDAPPLPGGGGYPGGHQPPGGGRYPDAPPLPGGGGYPGGPGYSQPGGGSSLGGPPSSQYPPQGGGGGQGYPPSYGPSGQGYQGYGGSTGPPGYPGAQPPPYGASGAPPYGAQGSQHPSSGQVYGYPPGGQGPGGYPSGRQ